jgi:hypothetical protein
MIDVIVSELKKGSVKAVVPFGSSTLPAAPYLVVKEEPTPVLGRTTYRVIGHWPKGDILGVRRYMRRDVYNLLANKTLTSPNTGAKNLVESAQEIGTLVLENDDKTVSMERLMFVRDLF